MSLIPLTCDSTAAVMGSVKNSLMSIHPQTHLSYSSAQSDSLTMHLYRQSPSASCCLTAVNCCAESHSFVSQAQGGERTASRSCLVLQRVTWLQNGGGSQQWVNRASLTLREIQAHIHDLKRRAGEKTVPQPWWWVHCGWLYQACCYLKPWVLGWEGKEGGMGICLWCVFGNGRGLASASFMMQYMGSCFCLCMDHKLMFVMFNTNMFCCNEVSAYKHSWPAFAIIQIHRSACTAHLFACVCVCVCLYSKCKCVWTLTRKSDS